MQEKQSGDITRLLEAWSDGDARALSELMDLVYGELSALASHHLRRERSDHTLEASALVHEAFLRLLRQQRVRWQNRSHFFGIASQAMRRVLVDHARQYLYAKRGSGAEKISLDAGTLLLAERAPQWLALDDALSRLAATAPQQARIVEMRFFGGLECREVAAVMGLSVATVHRRWRTARAWLYRCLEEGRTHAAAGQRDG